MVQPEDHHAVLLVGRARPTPDDLAVGLVEALETLAEELAESTGLPLGVFVTGVPSEGAIHGTLVAGLILAYAVDEDGPEHINALDAREIPETFWAALDKAGLSFTGKESSEGTFLVPLGWSTARLTSGEETLQHASADVPWPDALLLTPEVAARVASENLLVRLEADYC